MKLVELLASGVSEWHDRTERLHQDGDGRIYATCRKMPKFHKEWNEWDVSGHEVIMNGEDPIYGDCLDLADDYKTNVVNRAQWQAERDKQKGGEWKRHRAGRNQPVNAGVRVEVKLRCGDVQQGNAHEFIWLHSECDVAANIMQYRVISQPQAEEVEVDKFCTGYKCEATEENITHSKECLFEAELSYTGFKTDQIDGPIKWRDTVNELDAYIEEFTREREALINRLDEEGFALIPAMTAVTGVAKGSIPIEEWQVGDVIRVIRESNESCADAGRCYSITALDDIEPKYELDNNYYPRHEDMEFVSRP